MSRFDLSFVESEYRFYQSEEDHSICADGRMHRTWLNFRLSLDVVEPKLRGKNQTSNTTRPLRLRGEVQQAMVDSLQVVLPEDRQVTPFVHIQGTLHWRARHTVGDSFSIIDESTEHDHRFSGPARLGLISPDIPSGGVWVPPEKLVFATPAYRGDHFYAKELEDEMERIPEDLYRKLVEHQPDHRLRNFPWLSTAYRMAEYLLAQNELMRKRLMPIVQRSCKTRNAKSTLFCACEIWSILANEMLIQEVNYQLFMLQVVSRWPNLRLHYRIIPPNDQAAAEEGWILPQQLRCFAYRMEPFWSLTEMLARHGSEQTIQLNPDGNYLHYHVGRWLLQYCGKIHMRDGHALFSGYLACQDQIRLKFYL
jgi:hypothetical protein